MALPHDAALPDRALAFVFAVLASWVPAPLREVHAANTAVTLMVRA